MLTLEEQEGASNPFCTPTSWQKGKGRARCTYRVVWGKNVSL
ncbi:hypothetical protein HMPREF9134_01719 [Porphyromonas catoniae F0037]|uniref:Uncharacterized protein n=1 Tax=Porphyromonas catoniae F0037 TaxID=1127696 RepID=L1NAU6_9PORP|nr:hypothetical protein HMPREF9134_01719 [Porphyromonas catoniae F0037]